MSVLTPAFAGLWAEFVDPGVVAAALPTLARHGVSVNLAWPVDAADLARRWALVEAAERAGVAVHPWLLLQRDAGYWAGADNAVAFAVEAIALTSAWVRRGHAPTTLVIDLEPAHDRVMALEQSLRRRPPALRAAWDALRAAPSAARVRAAEATYTALVHRLHAEGWRVHLTTLPFVVDGGGRAGSALRDVLGLPVDGPDWDLVTLQAYRTLFADAACAVLGRRVGGRVYGPHLVHTYAVDARATFGDRAGLDLGLVGDGVYPAQIYTGPADLAADLGAARAAGLSPAHLCVYNLDGVLGRGAAEDWLAVTPTDGAPRPDRATGLTRRAIGAAGRLVARRRG